MKRIKRKFHIQAGLDLTPMIDMVFLLNIFFLLSSSFMIQPGIKVNLPQASVIENQKEKSVEISLTQEGLLFYDTNRITLDELKLKFRSLSKVDPQTMIVIKADGNIRHSKVVEIMSIAKNNNLSRFAIATRFKEEKHQ
ncbi:MAG: biopolymer transporter ExbD [Candidatus Aureabacteria bacterium]|nr:biopolymer transporter ExbD [Candidatus Auribacterota bacterium]